jgi:hypothetical protein
VVQQVVVNKAKDFLERVGWTAVQAAAGALLSDIISGHIIIWQTIAFAAAVAALKVVIAQNVGANNDGAAIPGGVIAPPVVGSKGPVAPSG